MFAHDEETLFEQRRRVVLSHACSRERVRLARIWHGVGDGSIAIEDSFFCAEREYLVLAPRVGPRLHPGRERMAILQDVLCYRAQKVVAMERGMAPSTVASNAKAALSFLGLECNPSRVAPMLQRAARAARDAKFDRPVGYVPLAEGPRGPFSVSWPRVEVSLRGILSEAEFCVVQALIEGASHVEIAIRRGTSARTVANQLAAAFRRLGVSSRTELLHTLGEMPDPDEAAFSEAARSTSLPSFVDEGATDQNTRAA